MLKNPRLVVVNSLATVLVVAFCVALRAGAVPLGVPGEWEWLRVRFRPSTLDLVLAGAGVLLYAGLAALGMRLLSSGATKAREVFAVCALVPAALFAQVAALSGAPVGYGLEKWVLGLHQKGASGYFRVAKAEVGDPWRFLAEYPAWIPRQDALHIGTHPPGLILVPHVLLGFFERNPDVARGVLESAPESLGRAFRVYGRDNRLSRADLATLATIGALTMLACSATVAPLYLLARSTLSAPWAWASAALWPLVPSAILFQPTADTAFTLFATTVLAGAVHLGRLGGLRRGLIAGVCGLVLGIGMQFSLVFLPVGLLVGIVIVADRGSPRHERIQSVLAVGAGFLGVTLAFWAVTKADPFLIWWWNQRHHARFYVEYPRSYRVWVLANPVELAVALGLPVSLWGLIGLGRPGAIPRVSLGTAAVLLLLTLSGKNLSEVARLWLPFMPALVVAAGAAMERAEAGPKTLAATVALLGLQTLALEAAIQVVYPV